MSSVEGYAGNASVEEAFEALSTVSASVLVDVRTQAEWAYVGIPDLRPVGKEVLLVEWQHFQPAGPNQGFVQELSAQLEKRSLDQGTKIYFLCRSGVRSQAAAIAMTAVGYENCYNVSNGFEGPLDSDGHRGTVSGWKFAGLPWLQN